MQQPPARGFRLYLSRFLLGATVALSPLAYASEQGNEHVKEKALVFGSYLNERYAQASARQLRASLGLDISIVTVDDAATTHYRVVYQSASASDLARARELTTNGGIAHARATTLPAAKPSEMATHVAPATAPIATSAPDPTRIEVAIATSEPEVSRSAPRPADRTSEPTSKSIGLVNLSPTGTEVSITLPRLVEDEFDFDLDGRLDEAFWSRIPGYDNMTVTDPDIMAEPTYTTVTRMFYTDKGMYFGVHMEQPPDTLIARLSSRDEFINRDSWGITLDTSGEGLYGYWVTVNLGGSVMDGKVAAERQYSNEWDGPWTSATAELSDGWSLEAFLPWSMMTMPDSVDGKRNMGFYINRKVAFVDERYTWPALPFTSTAFMSVLAQMQTPGVEPGQQIELYPNLSYTLDEIDSEDEYRAGLDLSWRPSSNLQVTATLNPDFGVVESDDVVINLSAFETFFPEKRLFFLEGREVFQTSPRNRVRGRGPSGSGSRQTTSTFNPEPTTLLNTRRIGGPPRISIPDDVDVEGVERGKPTDLLGAVKVTGLSGSLRYGVLSAFEDDVRLPGEINGGPNAGQPTRIESDGRDFGIARLLYEQTGAGRKSVGYMSTIVSYPDYDAIVHSIDGHWLSPDGHWAIDTQFMRSDVDHVTGSGTLADISYKPRQGIEHYLTLDWLDEDLNIRDLGFIRRNDSRNIIYRYNNRTSQGLKRLRARSISGVVSAEWNQQGRQVRGGLFLRNSWTLKSRNEIRTELDYFPARWDDRNSFGNGDFRVDDRIIGEIAFGTDTSKQLSFSALLGMRQEELSDWTLRSALGFTYQPSDRFSLEFDLNYFHRNGWLLHQLAFGQDDPLFDRNMTTFDAQEFQPRLAMDLFLTPKQQFRLTLQWAGIIAEERDFYLIPPGDGDLIEIGRAPREPRTEFTVSRMTAQLRYRWEIGPMSDLFVVYTRGSNLPDRQDDSFDNLFSDALDEPIIDLFVIKLRYRFGL